MKDRIYITAAAILVAGAVFYSGSAVLGWSHVKNPAQAGAQAAKPKGVPSCLTACPAHHGNDGDNDADDQAPQHHATAHAKNSANIQQNAVAVANGKNSVAIAKNTAVVRQHITVVRVVHPRVAAPHTAAPQTAAAPQTETETEAESVPSPAPVVHTVAAQAAPVPVAHAALPATGNSAALGTLVGTSSIAGAALYYRRSRQRLLQSAKGHRPGQQ